MAGQGRPGGLVIGHGGGGAGVRFSGSVPLGESESDRSEATISYRTSNPVLRAVWGRGKSVILISMMVADAGKEASCTGGPARVGVPVSGVFVVRVT